MIEFKLSEWEVMVLRAALAKHMKDASPKHIAACREIERKSKAKDNPGAVLKAVTAHL